MFHTASPKEIKEGKLTDIYFVRTMEVLKVNVRAMKEGTAFRSYEPIMEMEGPLRLWIDALAVVGLETSLFLSCKKERSFGTSPNRRP